MEKLPSWLIKFIFFFKGKRVKCWTVSNLQYINWVNLVNNVKVIIPIHVTFRGFRVVLELTNGKLFYK